MATLGKCLGSKFQYCHLLCDIRRMILFSFFVGMMGTVVVHASEDSRGTSNKFYYKW